MTGTHDKVKRYDLNKLSEPPSMELFERGEYVLAEDYDRLAALMPRWEPISTLPQNAEILLLHRYGAIHDAMTENGEITANHRRGSILEYTHWMPRPTPTQE